MTTLDIKTIKLDTVNACDTVLFGIFPNQKVSKLSTGYFPPPLRCGKDLFSDLILKNRGTTLLSGMLWFELDSLLADFSFFQAPDTIINQYLVGWKFDNLFPGNELKKRIYLRSPIPPNIQIGDHLKFRSYAEFNNGTKDVISGEFRYSGEIKCSFDPNDKQVHPTRHGNYTLFDEDLIYTIRFENMGNDYAYDIVVRDTLNDNLDIKTFEILSTSHPDMLNTIIEDDKFISFEFKNIFLTHFASQPGENQGYISYLIRAKEGLAENTPINNTASIYFDSNPPIVTNTTESVMVSELPTSFVENIDNQLVVNIFPNPTLGNIFIKGDNLQNAKITITDLTGRILKVEKLNASREISLPETAKGMFFLKVETEEGIAVKRVIKISQ